jgi:uncharacterized protein
VLHYGKAAGRAHSGQKEVFYEAVVVHEKQKVYYVVFFETLYDSFEDAVAKAPDVIAAHLARSKELHAQGTLLMAGAFLNNSKEPLGTMGVCTTREAAEEFARGDPFVLNGMVSKWYVREWANVFD